jgi:SAM-dependent methyltransferase
MILRDERDAFGGYVAAAFRGERRPIGSIERDDGWVEGDDGSNYLAPPRGWGANERTAIRLARGRVLDAGCGAGRVALHLQDRGLDVVAVDVSAGAIEVCRGRGVSDARAMAIEGIRASDGPFDTVVMYGNNIGLLRDAVHARWLLRRLHRATTPGAAIIGGTVDPYDTAEPAHVAYHARNRRRGRMGGQIRLRVRYQERATPWFDYLFLSREELEAIAHDAGWRVDAVFDREAGPAYVAVLRKTVS